VAALLNVPAAAGAGTVTSVAMTVPAEFSVAGSPITTSGTLAVTKATQTANTGYFGPTSGGAAAPAFRAMVAADLASHSHTVAGTDGGPLTSPRILTDIRNSAGTVRQEFVGTNALSMAIGSAALATTATEGFYYISSSAGPPTGTPTPATGRMPLHWDSTNKRLYVYDGSWRYAPLTLIGARVATGSGQSVTTATLTPVALSGESFDTDTMHDTVTNNSRLTAFTAGTYLTAGFVQWSNPGAVGTRWQTAVYKNGAQISVAESGTPTAGGYPALFVAELVPLAVTDYLELVIYQDSGVSKTVFAAALSAVRVGP
jgi:hypothetical protein